MANFRFLLFLKLVVAVEMIQLPREQWPRLGDKVTKDILDSIQAFDLLNEQLHLGFFIKGVAGPPGCQGPKGPMGSPGLTGSQGMPGWQGPSGKTGRQGPTGPPGPKGPPGPLGQKGSTGLGGLPGQAGLPGSPAPPMWHISTSIYTPQYTVQTNVTVVCGGRRALLQCSPGKRVKVTQARWGVDSSVGCANSTYPGTVYLPLKSSTDSSQVTDQIRKRCATQQNCEVEASGTFFSEDALNIPKDAKYLRVWHECIPDVTSLIFPSRRAKRMKTIEVPNLSQPRGISARLLTPLETESATGAFVRNSNREGKEGLFKDKSNEQNSSTGNESIGKTKRSEDIREKMNFARILDNISAPPILKK